MIHLIDRLTPQLFKLDASLHIHNSSTDPSLTRLLLRCPFICPPYTPALHPSFLVHPSTVSPVFFLFFSSLSFLLLTCSRAVACLPCFRSFRFHSFVFVSNRLHPTKPTNAIDAINLPRATPHSPSSMRPSLPHRVFQLSICLGGPFFCSSTWDRAWIA